MAWLLQKIKENLTFSDIDDQDTCESPVALRGHLVLDLTMDDLNCPSDGMTFCSTECIYRYSSIEHMLKYLGIESG